MSDYTPFGEGGQRRQSPSLVLIEQLGTLGTEKSGKLLTFALFDHPFGFELRASLGDDRHLLKSQVSKSMVEARELAAEWKAQSLAHGYSEVKGDGN
jgi:hypothetical protein